MLIPRLLGSGPKKDNEVWWFRSINQLATFPLLWLVLQLSRHISSTRAKRRRGPGKQLQNRVVHTTINVLLFPPLFFFYGLYYTDVLSVLSVLLAYSFHLQGKDSSVAVSALASLLFRQTNVFWTGVYLTGLQLQHILPHGKVGVEYPLNPTIWDVLKGSWTHACVFDPLINEAWFEVAFLGFVVWNGGVVLGDKSNHIATVHFAQMLYIWPYIGFFSFPLIYPYLINAAIPQHLLPLFLQVAPVDKRLPRLIIAIPVTALMLVVVYTNTIVHPFTLADNRHYMFYVFKLLRKHPSIKYLAVPIYFACAWAALITIAAPTQTHTQVNADGEHRAVKESRRSVGANSKDGGQRASWLIIWLATTTLTLSTAPLVEPRYCILPWLMWRMHVPAFGPGASRRLWLETLWFLLINAATCYMFLYRGFQWAQEPGNVQRFMW
ncbi:MAG: hypothetical protein Q9163_006440 [Psora crenata]